MARAVESLCSKHSVQTVVLSGGVYQNRLLLEQTSQLLSEGELTVLLHQLLPANDGGLSLGQAVIACARA